MQAVQKSSVCSSTYDDCARNESWTVDTCSINSLNKFSAFLLPASVCTSTSDLPQWQTAVSSVHCVQNHFISRSVILPLLTLRQTISIRYSKTTHPTYETLSTMHYTSYCKLHASVFSNLETVNGNTQKSFCLPITNPFKVSYLQIHVQIYRCAAIFCNWQ